MILAVSSAVSALMLATPAVMAFSVGVAIGMVIVVVVSI